MKKQSLIFVFALISACISAQVVNRGTLKIFSELPGTQVYLDERFMGSEIQQIDSIPVGTHYLKVLVENVNVYGELVEIKVNEVTTVLIKNTGQVAQKLLDSKTPERQEYQSNKLDIILTSGSVTQTKGYSNLFPGYYSYWGVSQSVSNTTQVTDWKIIQGGVSEVSERQFATLVQNDAVLKAMQANDAKALKLGNIGAITFLVGFIPAGLILVDMLVDKPFLHKDPEHPDYEAYVFTGGVLSAIVGYAIVMGSGKTPPDHYYLVEDAAKEARQFNNNLKQKLGLPESYDIE